MMGRGDSGMEFGPLRASHLYLFERFWFVSFLNQSSNACTGPALIATRATPVVCS